MVRYGKVHLFTLSIVALAGTIILGNWMVALATTKCKVPNPNEKFCTTLGVCVANCHTYDGNKTGCGTQATKDRKNFPDGGADSSSGTVKEENADCWRTALCIWDADTSKCNPPTSWGNWHQETKTVVGTNPCPTEE